MGSSSSKKEQIQKEQEELARKKKELEEKEKEINRREKEMMMEEIRRNEMQKMKEANNLDYKREKYFPDKIVLKKEQQEKILSQMTHSLCKILNNEKGCGTGFFCSLKYSEKHPPIKTLITNNHVLDIEDIAIDKKIKITINDCVICRRIEIGGKRKLYTNEELDITIIEILDTDHLDFVQYLEIDEKVFCPTNEKINKAYVIHYPGWITQVTSSFGEIEGISLDLVKIKHRCGTEKGSSGSPILDLSTYKIIGIHKGYELNYNVGTFLKIPIEEFNEFKKKGILDNYERLKSNFKKNIKKAENNKEKDNAIKLIIKVNKNDIGKEIYFLGNSEDNKIGNNELNKTNVEIKIDTKNINFEKYFIPEFEKEYSISLKFENQIKDCSYMFFNCGNITKIDLSSFNTKQVTNMNHMFGRCYNLKEIDLNNINTEKVTDMSYLFSKCKNLIHVDLSSFETSKVSTMCCMFHENYNITQIYLPFFITENVQDMSCMFCRCYKIQKLDLQSFNTKNVTDMSHMFDECIELKEILTTTPFFYTENANNLGHMFRRCTNLENIELKFKIKKAKYLSYMFSECEKITNINLSKFQTGNVKDMTYMFSGCHNLENLDLSTFSFCENTKVNNMFDDCTNLKTIKAKKDSEQSIVSQNNDYKDKLIF